MWASSYPFQLFMYSRCFSLFDVQLAKMLRKIFQEDRYHMFTCLFSYVESAFEEWIRCDRETYLKKRNNNGLQMACQGKTSIWKSIGLVI